MARKPGPPQDLSRDILDVFTSNICVLDQTGTIRLVNRAWREFSRNNPPVRSNICEGANYLTVCDRARGDPDAEEVGDALRAMIAARMPRFALEYPCHSPREERWFRVQAFRYLDHGAVRIVVAHEPITARKLAERAARETEDRYHVIVEEALDGFYGLDAEGRFAMANNAACLITGYPHQELIGMQVTKLFPPEDHARFAMTFERLKAGGTDHAEWCVIRKDGSRVYVEVRAHRQSNGQIAGFARDITERRETDKLRRTCASAEAANRAKDRFLAMLSHELRTPLAPVLAASQMIEEDPAAPEHVRNLALTVHRNVEVQVHLIDELLDQTRIARGKLELHCDVIDLREAVDQAVNTLEKEIEAKQLQLQVESQATRSLIRGDPARLQQILWNLLQNAAKFTPPHGTIVVRLSNPAPHCIRVAVADTGIGIEPTLLPRLFKPFEQGGPNTTRRFGGLGLGLAISKELTEMQDGSIAARSEGRDRGTTFELEFPLTNDPPAKSPHETRPQTETALHHGLRILVVEDHVDTARILGRLLERRGHRVHISHCVHDAESAAEVEPFDLVLSDVDLPDGTGYELMEFLRATHPVPGISISGFGMEQDVTRSREAGFAEHLVKPVEPRRLEETIEHVASASHIGER